MSYAENTPDRSAPVTTRQPRSMRAPTETTEERIQAQLRKLGVNCTALIESTSPFERKIVIVGEYPDYIVAKSFLKSQGWEKIEHRKPSVLTN